MDFERARIGLHINGSAAILADDEVRALWPELPLEGTPGRQAQLWVRVDVEEAYIHCAKHIPRLRKAERHEVGAAEPNDGNRADLFGVAAEKARRHRDRARTAALPCRRPQGRPVDAAAAAAGTSGARLRRAGQTNAALASRVGARSGSWWHVR